MLKQRVRRILIIGDTNCDFTLLQKEQRETLMFQFSITLDNFYGLNQLINDPTKETATHHIAVSNVKNIIESGVHRVALSDQTWCTPFTNVEEL